MLTEEQRQEIATRLSSDAAPVEPVVEEVKAKEGSEGTEADQEAAPPSADPAADGAPSDPAQNEAGKPADRVVPLEKHIQFRRERNELRQQLQEAREHAARLEGYVKAGGPRTQAKAPEGEKDWLDKILDEIDAPADKPEENPTDARLARVEKVLQEQEARENRQMLDQVVAACQKHDPTVPREFLVDRFAEGKTPEQALQHWNGWVAPLRQTQTQVPQAKPEVRAPPPAPPTVQRSPQGPSNSRPTQWADVRQAVQRAINGR